MKPNDESLVSFAVLLSRGQNSNRVKAKLVLKSLPADVENTHRASNSSEQRKFSPSNRFLTPGNGAVVGSATDPYVPVQICVSKEKFR